MHGDISFLELGSMESDTSKSQDFFAAVFGWQIHPMPRGGGGFKVPVFAWACTATIRVRRSTCSSRSRTWKQLWKRFGMRAGTSIRRSPMSLILAGSQTAAIRWGFLSDYISYRLLE